MPWRVRYAADCALGSSTSELVSRADLLENARVPVRDEFCPVAKAADAIGDRWSVLMIRELLRGVQRFNEFERSLPGISRSVLAQRLRHLERAGVIVRNVRPDERATSYRLTDAGSELVSVVKALNDWGVRWLVPDEWRVPGASPSELDPERLIFWARRHVDLAGLPDRRVVIAFELRRSRGPRLHYWLVCERDNVSVCPQDPGFAEDVRLVTSPSTLYLLLAGGIGVADAMDDGLMRIEGQPSLARAVPAWLGMGRVPDGPLPAASLNERA